MYEYLQNIFIWWASPTTSMLGHSTDMSEHLLYIDIITKMQNFLIVGIIYTYVIKTLLQSLIYKLGKLFSNQVIDYIFFIIYHQNQLIVFYTYLNLYNYVLNKYCPIETIMHVIIAVLFKSYTAYIIFIILFRYNSFITKKINQTLYHKINVIMYINILLISIRNIVSRFNTTQMYMMNIILYEKIVFLLTISIFIMYLKEDIANSLNATIKFTNKFNINNSLMLIFVIVINFFVVHLFPDITYKAIRCTIGPFIWILFNIFKVHIRMKIVNTLYNLPKGRIYYSKLYFIYIKFYQYIQLSTILFGNICIWYTKVLFLLIQISAIRICIKLFLILIIWQLANASVKYALYNQFFQKNKIKFEMLGYCFTILISLLLTVIVSLLFDINISVITGQLSIVISVLTFSFRDVVLDIIYGLIYKIDGTINEGDLLEFESKIVNVEKMELRCVRLRRIDGALITIPFHTLTKVHNLTRDFMYILLNIDVAKHYQTDFVFDAIEESYKMTQQLYEFKNKLHSFERRGITSISGLSMTLQVRIRVAIKYHIIAKRQLLIMIKQNFEKHNIIIPRPANFTEVLSLPKCSMI